MSRTFDAEVELRRHGAALRALALALLRDRDAADDVVQQTWLRALERPPRHGAAVGAWLATVLRHLASRWRRAERRRLRRQQAAARGETAGDAAAGEEMLQCLVDAVRALASPYREVVMQRFFEGHKPAAIAARSGVPLATVKSRLQRGLMLLRGRLQQSQQDDWRRALASAFGIGGGIAVAAATGAGVMGTATKIGFAAAVAVMAAAWWLLQGDVRPSPAMQAEAAGPIAAVAGTEAAGAQRVDVTLPVAPTAVAPQRHVGARVRGRLVAAESGAPLAGASIASGEITAATARDGTFELELEAKPPFFLRARCDGRATCSWRCASQLRASEIVELGDLPMRAGFALHGQLVDTDGAAVAGKSVVLDFGWNPGKEWGEEGVASGETDADGRFTVGPVPLGSAHVQTFTRLASPMQVAIDQAVVERGLRVVVATQPVIRGIVVDEAGRPARGIQVAPGPVFFDGVATAADGTFCIRRPSASAAATTGIFVLDAGKHAPPPPLVDVAWGSTDVRIVLHPSASIELQVVGEDGAPVTGFGIVVRRAGDGNPFALGRVQCRGEHADGRVPIDGIAAGQTQLRVLPTEFCWTPSEPIEVHAAPLRVALVRRVPARVQVLVSGRPIAGASVQLVHRRGSFDLSNCRQPALPLLDPRAGDKAWVPGLWSELVSSATTNGSGTAELWCDREPRDRLLVVRVEGRPPQLFEPLAFPSDGTAWCIELADCGRITGRVALREREAGQVQIVCEPLQTAAPAVAEHLTPARDGTFASPPLPVGSYRVRLGLSCSWQRGGDGSAASVPVASRVLVVTADDTAAAAFDLQDFAPAQLRGRVRAEGIDLASVRVDLVSQGDASGARRGEFAVGADGSFTATDVPPGSWRLAFRIGAGNGEILPAVQDEVFALQPGEQATKEFSLVRRRLVVHLRQPDGSSAAGLRVRVQSGGCSAPASGALAVLGIIAPCEESMLFDPAPTTPIRFGLDGRTWSEPVRMPPDRREAEVTVTLPEARR